MRRSYIAYTITNVAQLGLPDGTPMVEWKFYLPTSHPNVVAKSASPHAMKRTGTMPKIMSISEDLANFGRIQDMGGQHERYVQSYTS